MKAITIIAGPTAVGKTKFAIEAAKALDGEIVSCDSMQIYKYMDIGSAKPTEQERLAAKHHLIDMADPSLPFSVAMYQELAKKAIEDIFQRGKVPVVAGGTGLYLNSLIYDMDFGGPETDPSLHKKLEEEAAEAGPDALYQRLSVLDRAAADRIHPHNTKRAIRALEIAMSGNNLEDFKKCTQKCKDYDINFIILTRNRPELYDRINRRVDLLVEQGLFDEVESLLNRGLTESDISMKGIGYKEVMGFLHGRYSREEAIELIKKNTRRFAKRQITWFRRYEDATWLNISDYPGEEQALGELLEWLKKRYAYTTRATDPTTL